MRMREPKCTAYMWSTGKIVCTGSTSEESAKKAARKFCRRLLKIGYKVIFLKISKAVFFSNKYLKYKTVYLINQTIL